MKCLACYQLNRLHARLLFCFLGAACFAISACGDMAKNIALGRAAVAKFHQQLDAEQYDQIYAEADPALRQASARRDFVALMSAIHRKLGKTQDATGESFNVNWSTSGTQVRMSYKTKFAGGDAEETFVWHVVADRPVLLNYNINSNALIIN